ncbi:MAG: hypothetical protein EA427_08255 [Spirochaetaceae bacterium]|nr:MAG: hypothetical protein EA427_08255 [Spirochaetaceae bacterium]
MPSRAREFSHPAPLLPAQDARGPRAGAPGLSHRRPRIRNGAFFLTFLPALLLSCVSVPVEDPRLPSDVMEPATRAFILEIQAGTEGFDLQDHPEFLFLLDIDRSPGLVRELELRGILDNRVARRADRALGAAFQGEPMRIWVSGRYPRFWTAAALSSRGWRRRDPGVWYDGEGTEVTIYRGGLLRIETSTYTSIRHGGDGAGQDDRPAVIDVLKRASDDAAVLFFAANPPLERVTGGVDLGMLKPRDILIQVDSRDDLDLAMRFMAEREARVILVTLRLLSPRVLEAFRLVPGDRYALTREDSTVRLTGAGVTAGTWKVLADAIVPGENKGKGEDER